jgi:hypothetical protein
MSADIDWMHERLGWQIECLGRIDDRVEGLLDAVATAKELDLVKAKLEFLETQIK